MIAADIISTLATFGIVLFLDSGRLRFRAPEGNYTPDLKRLVADNKSAIESHLAALTEPTSAVVCPWCDSTNLADGTSGLWCVDCEKLAWIASPGRVTRADRADEESFPWPDP